MLVGIPKEILPNELRVAATPETVAKYIKLGFEVAVESGAGVGVFASDEDYKKAGARIVDDVQELFAKADVILKVKQPYFNSAVGKSEVSMLREGGALITFLHPAAPGNHDMIRALRDKNVTSFTMDGIPRTSRAQRMDALTSMSTVTGYKSMLIAASLMPKFVPMIGTAIGAIPPAKVLVIGAGVVGLQAVATAKRLGGVVEAIDIRANARQEAASLGAKVAGFEMPDEVAVGEGGYAKAVTGEWLEKERKGIAPNVAAADIIILSALVPGEVAPILITEEMVASKKPGSVIVDVSIDQGGNCAVTESGCTVNKHGVTVCGVANIPGSMAVHSSWLYANNMYYYVENLFKKGLDRFDLEDDIVKHSLVTYEGKIVFAGALRAMGEQ